MQVAGQALGGQVTGLTPQSVVCTNMTTGQGVTINTQAPAWNCRAAGLAVTPGDQASMRVQGTVAAGATTVGGAVTGLQPSNGGCANLTTGQQVTFQHMAGATAQSCTVSGLVVRPGDRVQMSVQGVAE